MSRRSTLHNAAFTLAGQISARALALVLYALLARKLGRDHYGEIGQGTAFGVIFQILIEPGLNLLLIRDGVRRPEQLCREVADLFAFKLAMLPVTWGLMTLSAALLGYRGDLLLAVFLCGGMILLVGFEDFAAAALTAQERMDLEGTLRFASKILAVVLGMGALLADLPFAVVIGSLTLAQALTALVGIALVRRSGVRIGVGRLAPVFRRLPESWPLAVTWFLLLVTLRSDQIIAKLMGVSEESLGDYNSGVKVVESLVLFPNAVVVVFQPVLARAWLAGKEACASELSLALQAALAVTLPIAVGGSLLATGVSTLIYGSAFAGAGPLLSLQLLVLVTFAIQITSYALLVAAGALRAQTLIAAAGLGVNLLSNVLLVPRLGVTGSTISALHGGAAASIGCLLAIHQLGVRLELVRSTWRAIVSSLVMAAGVLVVRERLGFFVSVLSGAVLYAGVFLLAGGWQTVVALKTRRQAPAAPEVASPGGLAV